MKWLKQSTACTVTLGPFVDDTDGKTAETALTVNQAAVRLRKNGGAAAQANESTTATHDENGYYLKPLNTTDTGTLGRLEIAASVSGALPVWVDFMVLPAMIYDSLIAGSDRLDTNVTHIGDTSQTARDLGASVLLSSGTGTGQLDFTSGVVKANQVQILGTTVPTPTVAGVPNVNVKTWNDLATVALPLVPTTAGRTLDVSAGGEAGIDWANVGSPTTAVDLSATTIDTSQKVDVNTIKTRTVAASGGITFPAATLASTTNITAGTITTVTTTTTATNLTNLPAITADWLTGTGVAASAVTKIQSGLALASGVALTTAERSKLTGYSTVVHVPHTGDNATSGANWITAVKAATAGTKVIAGPGQFDIDLHTGFSGIMTLPDRVTISGAGKSATVLRIINTYFAGNRAFIPGSNSVIEDLTIRAPNDNDVTADAILLEINGTTQVTNSVVRNVNLISDNLECVDVTSSKACSLEFDNVYMFSHSEWGLTVNGAAHKIRLRDVTCFVDGNGNTVDPKFIKIGNGTVLIAERCRSLTSEYASTGYVIQVSGSSAAYLTDCSFFDGEIYIADSGSYVLATNCEFDRSKVTGNPSRLVDVISPLRPATFGRTADVDSSGRVLLQPTQTGVTIPTVTTVTNQVTATANADALLARNVAGGSNGGRTVAKALFRIVNKVTVSGTTMTVYSTDDTTSSWTATLTLDGAADPVTAIDPA